VMENLAGSYVMVVDKNNVVDTRVVKTGLKTGACIQITSGLQEGEIVITDGQQKIRKGGKVTTLEDRNYAQLIAPLTDAGASKTADPGVEANWPENKTADHSPATISGKKEAAPTSAEPKNEAGKNKVGTPAASAAPVKK